MIFNRRVAISLLLLSFIPVFVNAQLSAKKTARQVFQLTVYHYHDSAQGRVLENYLEKALLPALSRKKISPVGVFTAMANDTAAEKKIYVFVPANSWSQLVQAQDALAADAVYKSAGKEYLDAGFKTPPYDRMEKILLDAFPMMPFVKKSALTGPAQERVYELRSYESATEKIGDNKIRMFNEGGEIDIFDRLGFDAAFYGKVISGPKMPNLMYLTRFASQAERDAHWKAFGADPAWKKLSALPEYQDNVSHIDIIFLRPTAYSAL